MFVPLWAVSLLGNLSCHQLLRDLKLNNRGQKVIPYPDPKRKLTILFNFVSCPNYFYEVSHFYTLQLGNTSSHSLLLFLLSGPGLVLLRWTDLVVQLVRVRAGRLRHHGLLGAGQTQRLQKDV